MAGPRARSLAPRHRKSPLLAQRTREKWGTRLREEGGRAALDRTAEGGCPHMNSLFHSQARQSFFEQTCVDAEAAAVGLYVFEFVEGAEEAELDGGILLGVAQGAGMGLAPGGARAVREKDADGVGQLAVGGNVEDEFGGGSFRIIGERRAFADKVVLVHVSLGTGIGLQAADGHGNIIVREAGVCRCLGVSRAGARLRQSAQRLRMGREVEH